MSRVPSMLRVPTARPVFEELEQRLLYSADFAPAALADLDTIDATEQRLLTRQNEDVVKQAATELVFIDPSRPDAEALIVDLEAQRNAGRPLEIVRIASDEDGIARISTALADHDGVDAAHVIGHGSDGAIRLGTAQLSGSTVLARAAELAGWGASLSDGADLLLYGCDIAASESGQVLVADLAALTGADVKASDDLTGALLHHDAESDVGAGTAAQHRREIVFVDDSLEEAQTLIGGIARDRGPGVEIEVVRLTAAIDGLRQISEALAAESRIDAVHIVSHGGTGQLLLGNTVVDANALLERANEVGAWNSALASDADILIYGCDVGAGDEGLQFVAELSRITGADVAASSDRTGHEILGGDWDLEAAVGQVGTSVAFGETFRSQWLGLLPTYQQFTSSPSESEFKSDANWGQTFQHNSGAGTYNVNQVSLALRQDAAASAQTITVTLRNSWNGTVLGTASIDSSSLGTSLAWVDFNFAGVNLNDNQSYTIRVTSSTIDGKVYAGFDSSGGYANGSRIDTNGSALASEDTAFRVSSVNSTQLNASQDTYIRLNPPDTTNNYGASTQLIIDRESTDLQRALLQFDLSAIPANATITSAALTMQATQVGGTLNISVYEVQRVWSEGTGNGTPGTANWNQSAPGNNWTSAGGDFNATAVTILNTNATGQHVWSLTPLVQAWVDGSKVNNGVLVASPDGGGNRTATYDSSEGTTPPRLVITYTVPPNSAPTLDASRIPVLAAQFEDAAAPSGAVGTLVSSLVDFAAPAGQVDNVTDADAGAQLGIAVTAASTTNGGWHYSTNGGTDWSALGSVSGSSARLLAADANTRIYFQPTANYNGTQATAVTFRAWDQTSGTNGGTADTGSNGGGTAFSSATDTASQAVLAVNDAPVITNLAGDSPAYSEGNGAVEIDGGNATVTDVDSTDFSSGTLTISFTAGSDSAEDVLAIRNQGTGAGQIGVSGSNVTHGGTIIGSFTGGSAGASLVVTFNASSTPGAAQALVRNITYGNTDIDAPTAGVRGVRFAVTDGDGAGSGNHDATVTVSAVNDAPAITSNGGGANAPVSVAENATAITTVTSTDVDGGAPAYSISGGADAARFTINATSGVLSFGVAQNREALTDANADSVYEVVVQVSDGAGGSDTQAVSATVIDVDEFDVGAISETNVLVDAVAENSANGSVVGITALASDADATNNTITYSLPDDSGGRFAIDGATGVVTVGDGSLLDRETAASHGLTVRAISADGSFSTQAFTIALTDIDEFDVGAVTDSNGAANQVTENAANGTAVGVTALASDADASANAVTYALTDNAGGRFAINAATGIVTVADGTLLDYEAATSHAITARATSADGSFSTQAFAIAVSPINEHAPVISSNGGSASASVAVAENSTTVTTVNASDADAGTAVTYAIAGGADAGRFAINASTGLLTFLAPPDYEAPGDAGGNNVYDVTVQASDGVLTDTQSLAVSVSNLNDNVPVITSNGGAATASVTVAENSTAVTTVNATDVDAGSALTYSVAGGADAARFAINAGTGELTFLAPPDYEAPGDAGGNNVYDVTVQVSDSLLTDTQSLTVSVSNVNDNLPVITSDGGGASALLGIAENSTTVTTVTAIDADTGSSLVYSLSGGADAAAFTINSSTGVLTFLASPDYESPTDAGVNNVYDVTVQASDGVLTDSQSLAVSVGNVNDSAPVITSNGGGASALLSVAENSTTVTTVTATDIDASAALTYSIGGGADAGRFAIDAGTGVLTFLAPPDYESPADAGGNNVYDVTVQASDGVLTDSQSLAVSLSDVNDVAPVITSNGGGAVALASVAENSTTVTTVTATDVDSGAALTYAIAGGADAGLFAINAGTGVLTFLASPDYESPTDSGVNNVYDVTVQASDGVLTDTQSLAVSVGNVNDNVPVIAVNTLTLAEGGSATPLISGVDPDNTPPQLSYAVSSLSGGRFELTTAAGVGVSFFTQGDVDAGIVPFVSNGGEAAPAYLLTLSDGTWASAAQPASVTYTSVNDAPAVVSIALGSVTEETSRLITPAELLADVVDPDNALLSVLNLTLTSGNGTLDDNGNGTWTFTPAADWTGSASFSFAVTDGSMSVVNNATLLVGAVNDAPIITSNGGDASALLSVAENSPTVTTVTAIDADAGATLTYSIAGGADAARFTIDPVNGDLRFISPPDYEQPADADLDNRYEVVVSVSDSQLTAQQVLSIVMRNANEAPVILANGLQLTVNDTALILRAADSDTPADALAYAVTDVVGGRFELIGVPGQIIVAFTQADVDAGLVRLIRDGSGMIPSYVLTLTDGVSTVTSGSPDVSFVAGPVQTPATPAVLPSPGSATPADLPSPVPVTPADLLTTAAVTQASLPDFAPASASYAGAVTPATTTPAGPEGGGPTRIAPNGMPLRDALQPDLDPTRVIRTGPAAAMPSDGQAGTRATVSKVDIALPSEDAALLDAVMQAQDTLMAALRDRDLEMQLNRVRDQVAAIASGDRVPVASTLLLSSSLSVGYVLWLGRGGVLMGSLLSALPAWARLDPLPVLAQARRREDDREGDAGADDEHDRVERMFAKARQWIGGKDAAGAERK